MKKYKIFTALIIVAACLAFMGLMANAFATTPSTSTTEQPKIYTIDQKTAYEGITKVAAQSAVQKVEAQFTGQETSVATSDFAIMVNQTPFSGNTIDTAVLADQMIVISKKADQAEAKLPISMVVAETAPSYIDAKTLDAVVGNFPLGNLILVSDMDVNNMDKVALVAWQNGGGPIAGSAQAMAIETAKKIYAMKKAANAASFLV